MEQFERQKLHDAVTSIDQAIQQLQIQVLNNIDAQLNSTGDKSKEVVIDTFIKKPIMQAVMKLKARRSDLLKLANGGQKPNSARV